MKEIKAYVQRHLVNNAVDELERAGAPGITIIEIHPVGYGYEPNYFGFQSEDAIKRYADLRVVKLEVVCADQDWERIARGGSALTICGSPTSSSYSCRIPPAGSCPIIPRR
jgi:nitrogen regulatory protein PII